MAKLVLTEQSINFLVLNKELLIKWGGGEIILEQKAKEMMRIFSTQNDGSTILEYLIDREKVDEIISKIRELKEENFNGAIPWDHYEIGIYAYIGKKDKDPSFQIVLEPIAYKVPFPGHMILHNEDKCLKDNLYYAFHLDSKVGFYDVCSIAERNNLVEIKDMVDKGGATEIVFMKYDNLSMFVNNAKDYNKLKLSFARNADKGRITLILSCLIVSEGSITQVESRVENEGIQTAGLYSDDNDLLP